MAKCIIPSSFFEMKTDTVEFVVIISTGSGTFNVVDAFILPYKVLRDKQKRDNEADCNIMNIYYVLDGTQLAI